MKVFATINEPGGPTETCKSLAGVVDNLKNEKIYDHREGTTWV